jgi:phosphate transport system protein
MWSLVIDQVTRSKTYLIENPPGLINEIILNEKRIDSFEIKIDMDAEEILKSDNKNITQIISILKINSNLERIGDYAYTISKIIKDRGKIIPKDIIKHLNIEEIFDVSIQLLEESLEIYNSENKNKISKVYELEETINFLRKNSVDKIYNYFIYKTENSFFYLDCLSIINKLERLGDHVINIIESIVSYLESRITKHEYLKNSQVIYTKKDKDLIKVEDIVLDKNKYTVNRNGVNFNLPKKEFELFHLLISDVDKVFTREEILSKVWGDNVVVGSKTIDVHIRKIRKKLEINNIVSIKGIGYKYSLKNS